MTNAVELALYQPDIAANTGALLRLGACLGVRVHIIHPAGFALTREALRRTGLDYLAHADWVEHAQYADFRAWALDEGRRIILLTTKAEAAFHATRFRPRDILMLGRESAGVPETVAAEADLRLRIPMRPGMRSLNVALAATLVLGEALRQTDGYADLA